VIFKRTRPHSKEERKAMYLAYVKPLVLERQEQEGMNSEYTWDYQQRKFVKRSSEDE